MPERIAFVQPLFAESFTLEDDSSKDAAAVETRAAVITVLQPGEEELDGPPGRISQRDGRECRSSLG